VETWQLSRSTTQGLLVPGEGVPMSFLPGSRAFLSVFLLRQSEFVTAGHEIIGSLVPCACLCPIEWVSPYQ